MGEIYLMILRCIVDMNTLYRILHLEPSNQVIKDKISWCERQRSLTPAQPTVPSTIQEEKSINPFMRVCEPTVQAHTGTKDPIETMAALRTEKDSFKAPARDPSRL